MIKYKVGQIIYLLSDKSLKVIPTQVVEEVVRNTMDGKQTSYTITMPNKDRTCVDLNSISAKIFTDPHILENFMIENAKKSIRGLMNEALSIQEIFVKTEDPAMIAKPALAQAPQEASQDIEDKSVQTKNTSDKIKIDIGNGIRANVKIEDLESLGLNS